MNNIIEIEKKAWDIFLSDEYYKSNSKKISYVDYEKFDERYQILKSSYEELKDNLKERDVIKTLFKKYNIDSKIFIFQGDIKGCKQAGCYNFGDKTIFIISKPIIESFLEHDLFPIISHEIGHIVNKTPITPPNNYFYDKVVVEKSKKKEELRLFTLSSYLAYINEYRADLFALENSENFEHVVNSYYKMFKLSDKSIKEVNIYKILNNYYKLRKKKDYDIVDYLDFDHPLLEARIFLLFIESRKNKLLYSKSLYDIDSIMSIDDFLEFDKIIKLYRLFI